MSDGGSRALLLACGGHMNPDVARIFDGKKFMWDGKLHESREEASRATDAYRADNFEVRTVEGGDKVLLYTRRVVKEAVVTVP